MKQQKPSELQISELSKMYCCPKHYRAFSGGLTVTAVSLVGYSAMAGIVGGGGVGDLAIRFGYYRYQTDIMIITVVLLIILVQIVQSLGDFIAKKADKK